MFCGKSRVTFHLRASERRRQQAVMEEGVGRRDGELEEHLGRSFPSSFNEEFASQMIYILDDDTASLFLSGTAATAGGRYLKKN